MYTAHVYIGTCMLHSLYCNCSVICVLPHTAQIPQLVSSTTAMYNTITTELLPTPAKSHYTFNLRDLSKVFQGMLMVPINKLKVLLT